MASQSDNSKVPMASNAAAGMPPASQQAQAQVQTQAQTAAVQESGAQKKAQKPRRKSTKKERIVFTSNKRKEAKARAVVKKGTGRITINSIDINMFEPKELRSLMLEPINISNIAREIAKGIDIKVNVNGGGISAQAQAARGAIAKGIAEYAESDTIRKEYLRYDRSLLVADPRRVEPKKFKGPKARARFQTSYR